ncbi:MAG: hypothetical protein OXH04_08305 [Acidobacteria bacterium]|nr:hypothetical protein [Acidobacteriota bacterium]
MFGLQRSSRVSAAGALLVVFATWVPAYGQQSQASPPEPEPATSGKMLELQFGGGYLFREGDLAYLPSIEMGVTWWWHDSWGISVRRSMTVGEHMASYDYGDGTRTGGRNFRHWTGTLRYRRALDTGLELNVGGGLSTGVYDHLVWYRGPRVNPRPESMPLSLGGVLGEVLLGKRIAPRLGIKGGMVAYLVLDETAAAVPVLFGTVSF